VNLPRSYLPPHATNISNTPNGKYTVEIAVPINGDLVDLGYPRLFGTFKIVNGTWSVKFIIDFLLLEKSDDDYVFEVETVSIATDEPKMV